MEIIRKIWLGILAALDAMVGRPTDDKQYVVGFIAFAILIAIFSVSFILLSKFTKWAVWARCLTAIGITIGFCVVVFLICLAIGS